MLFVNYKIGASREDVLGVITDSSLVVEEESFDTSRGKPLMHIKSKSNALKIRCELTGRATKDNGFLEGTYFLGRLTERGGVSKISGVILTAPIYHFFFLLLFAFFIYRCISLGGFSPIPVILLIFDAFMFKDEFRKQGIIKKYIFRSLKITYRNAHKKK